MNPYRTPGTKDCVTELVEQIIESQFPKPGPLDMKRRDEEEMMKCVNILLGHGIVSRYATLCDRSPRLTVTHLRWDPFINSTTVRVEGKGPVHCDLTFSQHDLSRRGWKHGYDGKQAILFGLYDAILEKLPE